MSADKVNKPTRKKAARPASRSQEPIGADPDTDFLARAWGMEVEAVERYSMLADIMEQHNNTEVAELFRKLARIEQLHADRILEENPGMSPPQLPAAGLQWD